MIGTVGRVVAPSDRHTFPVAGSISALRDTLTHPPTLLYPSTRIPPREKHKKEKSKSKKDKKDKKEKKDKKSKHKKKHKKSGKVRERGCLPSSPLLSKSPLTTHLLGQDEEIRSAIDGHIIKRKITKTSGDKERDLNRKSLLQFLNSSYE